MKNSGTPLINAKSLGKHLGIKNLFFKLESKHPTGSAKDRAACLVVEDAVKNGSKGITVGSCGSYGLSIAYFSSKKLLPCDVFIPANFENKKINKIFKFSNSVKLINGTYEDAVEQSVSYAKYSNLYDGNVSGPAKEICKESYRVIGEEIVRIIGNRIESIWVPVGNGTTSAGLFRYVLNHNLETKFGLASSYGNNALIKSISNGKILELEAFKIKQSAVNEPLVNWKSFDAEEVFESFHKTGGWYSEASDEQLVQTANLLFSFENIKTSPASASSLFGLIQNSNRLKKSDYANVVILTD